MPSILQQVQNLLTGFLILLVTGYQKTLSPFVGRNCRFYPSCSCYAKEALRTHGSINGVILTSCRILRCNPFCEGGRDPVPEQFSLFDKLKF